MLPHRLVVPEVIRQAWGATNGFLWKTISEDTRMAIARSVVEEQRKQGEL